jgi:hypothetical protein
MVAAVLLLAGPAMAAETGLVKVSRGAVHVERDGRSIPATVGTSLQPADVIVTGADGSAGITFADNSLVSVGPGSVFSIDRYAFDSTTHAGEFQGTLTRGRLAAVSGKLVQQSPESMKIRTPSAVMGVRGTEFLVQVDAPQGAAR